uniref:Macrophage-expressed gene 1 protein n=1 Tax=Neogobius melanostomus TaxID=47308 RepID=A0A8C6WJ62_9GOBI
YDLSVSILLLLLYFCKAALNRPSNWLRQCRASTNLSITSLGVLPGGGWDNLRNIDMGRVMNLSYFQCQTTEDGLYLIPDETSSEIISSWLEQKSVTSSSINADVSFLSMVNGKFSTENQRMKTHQVKDSATTTRVQVRNFIYIVKAYPDFTLDSRFAQQAKDIADAIENNQTKNAAYLSEKMVVDYGTHVITTVNAGASLVEEDYLDSKYVSDSASQSSNVKAQAGFNFFDKLKFDIGGGSSSQSSTLQAYQSNITYSIIQSHGGVPFYPGISLQKWQESTTNNLVAIDRSGVPLHHLINHNTLPDLPRPTVEKVSRSLKKAIERYYKVNTRPGCVDVSSNNYNFQANVDDASCEGPATNLSFGGVYQQCEQLSQDAGPLCDKLAQRNPDTGDFSCRAPYTPTLLRSEICQDNYYVRSARINTYWCSVNGKAPDNSGYLFGGLYSPSMLNPITNSKGCPPNFIAETFLSDGMMLCVSRDYETGSRYAVQFGGLFSCQSTNPLANGQRRCPPRFSQHLAIVSDGCEILYCVQSGLFTGGELKPIRLPPFTKPPLISMQATNTVMVMTEGQKSWVRVGTTKLWKLAKPEEIQDMVKKINSESNEMSSGEKTGVAFGVLALVALVIVVAVLIKKRRRLPRFHMTKSYEEIQGDAEETERLTQQPA